MKLFLSKKKVLFIITFIIFTISLSMLAFVSKFLGNITNKIVERGIRTAWKELVIIIPIYLVHYIIVVFYIYFQNLWILELKKDIMSKKLKTNKSFEKAWNETNIYVNNYISPMLEAGYIIFGMISALIVISTESYILAVSLLFVFIFSYFIPKVFNKKIKVANKNNLKIDNEMNEKISGFERNYLTISNNNQEMAKILIPISLKKVFFKRKKSFYDGVRNWIPVLINNLIFTTIIVTSAILIYLGKAKIGTLVVAVSAICGYMHALPNLSKNVSEIGNNKWITKIKDTPDQKYISYDIKNKVVKKIKIKNVGKEKIFNKLNFEIKENENVLIVGENGSGKSTISKIIAGLDKKYDGQKYINNDSKVNYNDTSVIYQSSINHLIPGKAFENIVNFREHYDKKKLDKITNLLKINDITNKDVKKLSSGETAMIKIAHILYHNYKIRIYDELLMNIDKIRREKIMDIILNQRSINIFISHSMKKEKFNKFDRVIEL